MQMKIRDGEVIDVSAYKHRSYRESARLSISILYVYLGKSEQAIERSIGHDVVAQICYAFFQVCVLREVLIYVDEGIYVRNLIY